MRGDRGNDKTPTPEFANTPLFSFGKADTLLPRETLLKKPR